MPHDKAKFPNETRDLFEALENCTEPMERSTVEIRQPRRKRKKSPSEKTQTTGKTSHCDKSGSVFLTDQDVARRFKLTRQTIWRWVGSGRFPAPFKLSAGTSRWRLEDILAFERKLPRHIPNSSEGNKKGKKS
ncbi:MAG: transcriptional regulator [Thalassococcus sp.]|uniref:helix-turn-helix transcriptional regulator n=1 Tax=Thalassococcus sp. TaxID=1928858 RepID=UPI001B0B6D6D|nr:helix-turn-helix domain-containing protein [Thalassococcus sp.]MBO6867257.1 transcriptional regulator [Thalassococcus sp.]